MNFFVTPIFPCHFTVIILSEHQNESLTFLIIINENKSMRDVLSLALIASSSLYLLEEQFVYCNVV